MFRDEKTSLDSDNLMSHKEFRETFRKSLKEGRPILITNTEKYRRSGKTTMIVNYMSFVEDACLIVPTQHSKTMYVKEFGIHSERIIVARELDNIRGYTKNKRFVMDEIPYKKYIEIRQSVCQMRDVKLSGIVTIYQGYLVL